MAHAAATTSSHLAALVLTIAIAAPAPEATSHPIPTDALAWWRYDPSAFPLDSPTPTPAPERTVLMATLRAALASGALGKRTGAMLGALLLVGLEAGDTPHTLALLDFAATRPPDGTGIDIQSLAVAMRIDSTTRHPEMLRTLRAIAIDAFPGAPGADPDPGAQARFDLPDGRTGIAFRKAAWEPWREVSWCSDATAFTIGIGRDALPTWFVPHPEAESAPPPRWHALRTPIDAFRPQAPVVFECFIDFQALRERFPSAFIMGRTPRMLAALELRDAHALLFQARVVPAAVPDGRSATLMAIDAAILMADGTIDHRPFSHHEWPALADPSLLPPGASAATIASVHWPDAFHRILAIHTATIPDRQVPKFLARRDAWLGRHRGALEEALALFQPIMVISTHDRIPAPLPGVGCIAIPALPGAAPGTIAAALERILATFHPAVRTDPPKNAPSPVWSLRVDRTGLVRLPWWTLTRAPDGPVVLVGAWAAAPLETARRWLGGEAPP